jgi:GAF domain-containing protein
MEEAVDQKAVLDWPNPEDNDGHVRRAHEQLAQSQGAAGILSVPLVRDGQPVGALCLERERPFDVASREMVEALAVLLGPLVAVQQAADRGPVARSREALRSLWIRLFGPGHLVWKAAGALAVVLIEHDMTVIESVAQRCAVLDYGRKLCEGSYAQVTADPEVRRAYLGLEE